LAWLLLGFLGVKGLTAALFAIVATMASAASIQINSAFPSDGLGNAVPVVLGESFYVTAKLTVDSPLNGTYRVRFDLPYANRETPELNFGGDATVTWGPFVALVDGQISVKTSVESSTDVASDPLTIAVSPALPTQAVEYFGGQAMAGSVTSQVQLSNGTAAGLRWFAPIPTTGGFQQVLSMVKQGSTVYSTPFAQPVSMNTNALSTSVQFSTVASSVRTNPDLLRKASFDSYKSLPSNASVWLRAEALVESRSSDITSFVAKSLPKNYRATMKPYDAARMLFLSVVARMRYATVTTKPDAVVAARTGRGDCGFFSALFVAACRNIGIPARTVSGMVLGDNEWHVWAEFWIPGAGWVPADPTYCDTLCPDGSLALYFGTIPELNQRVALTYGFDHTANGYAMNMLQSPAVYVSGSTRVSSIQGFCSLSLATGN
jgi:transglutaminase-like putative cysteine protease